MKLKLLFAMCLLISFTNIGSAGSAEEALNAGSSASNPGSEQRAADPGSPDAPQQNFDAPHSTALPEIEKPSVEEVMPGSDKWLEPDPD